jgi:zinc protease
MSDKYITANKAFVIVVGDKKVLPERLKKFSYNNTVEVYDYNGNPVKESAALPKGIDAATVIEKYIDAIGGREEIENLEDYTMLASTSMNGMTLNMNTYYRASGEFASEVLMNGKPMQKQVYNGKVCKVSGMQGNKEITGEELVKLKLESKMNKFLNYKKYGISTKLVAIESVDGKDAYKIEIVKAEGDKTYDFYDVETGLKIQTKTTMSTPRGDFTQVQNFSNYKVVKGIKYPFTIATSGMQNITLKVESIAINEGIEDSVFE